MDVAARRAPRAGAERAAIYCARVRLSTAIRATAWGMVAAGVAAPLLRKRVSAPAALVQTVAYGAPLGLAVALRRTRARDVAVCALQMWAYVAAYKAPHDDEAGQAARVRIEYPIVADRVLGLGELPTVRMQRALLRLGPDGPRWRPLDSALVWIHWSWFLVPHGAIAYTLARHPRRFPRAAALMYSTFNIGASVYWFLPTAPPWYAAGADERTGAGAREVRRLMVEYGEDFWGDRWGSLYSVFGGNPLAAMPSLHFATSVMAALLLAEAEPLAGAFGWAYTTALGVSLVYLGGHYVVDLAAGAALTAAVRRAAPRAAPAFARFARAVAAVEARAHAG
jgi:membrane-associated phospholipid phosphatase